MFGINGFVAIVFFSFPEYASLLGPSTFKYFSQVIMAEGKLLHWQLDIQSRWQRTKSTEAR
jgi:hypothetical protein